MQLIRPIATVTLAGATLLAAGAPALAAPPDNDGYAGRTVIGSVPFSDTVDTSGATTDGDDAGLNTKCLAPETDASVWYEWTPPAGMSVVVDAAESDYSAGVLVGVGSPGSFEIVNCAPKAVAFFAEAGQTYRILAVDDQYDGVGNGGTLKITVAEAPPPPEIDVDMDQIGTVNPVTGGATVTGTVTCVGEAAFAGVDVELTQSADGVDVRGWGFTDIPCHGQRHPWSVDVQPDGGSFAAGQAASVTFGTACGPFDCGTDYEERTVWLGE